jgi:hypothetical protein
VCGQCAVLGVVVNLVWGSEDIVAMPCHRACSAPLEMAGASVDLPSVGDEGFSDWPKI